MGDLTAQSPPTVLSLSPPGIFGPAYERWRDRLPKHHLRQLEQRSGAGALELLPDADIVLGDWLGRIGLDRDAIERAQRCVAVIQPSAGYQLIDVQSAREHNIPVANAPGANALAVAEWVIMSALMLLRSAIAKHNELDSGVWRQEEIMTEPVYELKGKTFGIIGLGNIGRQVARRLKVFDLSDVLYTDAVRVDLLVERELNVHYCDLDELCSRADLVTIHVPLTPETHNLLDSKRFDSLKEGAIVINASRGAVVDEGALRSALAAGRLRGAAMDVFSEEPLADDHHWRGLPNVVLSPHVAGASHEAIQRMFDMAFGDLSRVLEGQPPLHVVNGVQGVPRFVNENR